MELFRTDAFMVLKGLILFILISGLGHAQRRKPTPSQLRVAQKQLSKRQYSKALSTLSKAYDLKRPARVPVPALNMTALIYQRQRKFAKSSMYFHYVIKKAYAKNHVRAIKAYKAGAIQRVKLPKKLLVIYYYMGQNYYYLYSDTKQSAYFKASYTYLDIVDKKGSLGSRASKYLASLKEKKQYVAKLEKEWSWYATAGWITWQESITLAEKTNTDNTSKVLASNSGYCVGGGFRYANVRHGFNVNGCGFAGSANLYEKPGASYQYRQNNVPVNGLYLSTGYFFRPLDDSNSIGVSLPMFFRQGEYSETDTRKVLGSGTLSAGGISLDAEFEIYKGLSLYTNLASINSTNLLLMQAKYEF